MQLNTSTTDTAIHRLAGEEEDGSDSERIQLQ